jgi:hypothetical protein
VVKLKLGHYKMPEYMVGKASKLRQKYFGNFAVVAVHSPTAIELRLPEYMHIRVHPVIHPQYLMLAERKSDGQFKTGVEKGSGLRELIEGAMGDTGSFDTANGYGVEEIVAHRKVGIPPDEVLEYLIRERIRVSYVKGPLLWRIKYEFGALVGLNSIFICLRFLFLILLVLLLLFINNINYTYNYS